MFHGNQTCRDSVIENEFSLFFKDVIIQTLPEKKIVCYKAEVLTSLIIYRKFNGTCDLDKHIKVQRYVTFSIMSLSIEHKIACTDQYDKLIESIQ